VLSTRLASVIPPDARILDVGCGSGALARRLMEERKDVQIRGLDVLRREDAEIPVDLFDGRSLPHPDRSFDGVLFVDVLHHTDDPLSLLREAARVSSRCVIIKDHLLRGLFARVTLRGMDWVGNARHGVALPYNYWRPEQWERAFEEAGLHVEVWEPRLGLYPAPAAWIFERSLHFLARLARP
jgi:SAM-dependent methyltransferase